MVQPMLTTLENVKAWLSVTELDDDALLERLIGQVSRLVMSWTNRSNFFQTTIVEARNGSGSDTMTLRQWPVTSVASVVVGSTTVPVSTGYGSAGWTLEPWDGSLPGRLQQVTLQGYCFWQATRNVVFTYNAGYAIFEEPQTVQGTNEAYTVVLDAPGGPWGANIGVYYASTGAALTKVSTLTGAGQYTVDDQGNYAFDAADVGVAVLVSYSYTPSDIEEAVIDTVAERYRYKERIGVKSQSLVSSEVSSFDTSGLTKFAVGILSQYRNVVPVS